MQTTTLLDQALAAEAQRHAATIAAIESRAHDLQEVDRLLVALNARGWRVMAHADCIGAAPIVECRIRLHASVTAPELAELLDYLQADGVFLARVSRDDLGRGLRYHLRLARFGVTLDAYLHPAKVAA